MALVTDRKRGQRESGVNALAGSTHEQDIPGWSGRLMIWLRVAAQLVGIQLLMLAGTLLGLVIAGLGPALAAGAGLLRRIVEGDPSDHLWRDFWSAYRADFRRAALVTAPFLVVVGLAWYETLVLLAYGDSAMEAVLTGATLAVGLYALSCVGFAPHVLRRYTDGAASSLRFVALAPLLTPLTTLGVVVTTVAILLIGVRFLPALVLVGLSIPLLLGGILVDRWLDKIDARAAS